MNTKITDKEKAINIKLRPYFNFNLLFPSYERTYSINRYDYELLQELNYINNPSHGSPSQPPKKVRRKDGDISIQSKGKEKSNKHIKYPCYEENTHKHTKMKHFEKKDPHKHDLRNPPVSHSDTHRMAKVNYRRLNSGSGRAGDERMTNIFKKDAHKNLMKTIEAQTKKIHKKQINLNHSTNFPSGTNRSISLDPINKELMEAINGNFADPKNFADPRNLAKSFDQYGK
jgi:hypothetical protein